MDLIKGLNRLGVAANRNFPYLNCGGCAVFAYLVGQELHNRGVEVYGIVAAYGAGKRAIGDIRKRVTVKDMADWQNNGLMFNHVGLAFKHNKKWYHYDSNGVHLKHRELLGMTLYRGRMKLEEVGRVAMDPEGWNDCFDRDGIPRLQQSIRRIFKQIEV